MPTDDTVPGQLEAIHERLDQGDKRMAAIESEVAKNTAITNDIKEILDAVRLGLKTLGVLGAVVKWGGMVAGGIAALWALFHQGPKP